MKFAVPTDNTSPTLPPKWLHKGGVAISIHCTTTGKQKTVNVCICACVLLPDLSTQPHATTVGGNIGLVLSVGTVVCSELHLSFNGFIMQRAIPILSPLVFMPSLLFTSFLPFFYGTMCLQCKVVLGVARLHVETIY